MKKLLRNWEAVAAITCPETKYALAVCRDMDVLQRLVIAFPHCFREGWKGETDRFSWKRILDAANAYHSMQSESRPPHSDTPYMWLEYLLHDAALSPEDQDLAGIPVLAHWGTMWWGNKTKVPKSIVTQLVALRGQKIQGPLFLEHQGVQCVVGCIWFEYGGTNPWDGKIFDIDPDQDGLHELALVPADVISFDC